LRITLAWYVLLLALVAVSNRDSFGGGAWASLLGLTLMILAALGRVWVSVHIAGRKSEHLVTTGPYAACRHPLYALSLLGGLGVGLVTRSVALTLATLVVLVVLHVYAIRAEERWLRVTYGAAFDEYRARVPALLPRWKVSGIETQAVTVSLGVYWKAFLDAASFLLIYVLIELLEILRAAGTLPTWFEL
jgi:protein-S-isoprenylcysteine O-methyltransferase Ste14